MPIQQLDTYTLLKQTARVGIWKDDDTGIVIVGTRGTQIGQTGGSSDAADDLVSFAICSNAVAIAWHKLICAFTLSSSTCFNVVVSSIFI